MIKLFVAILLALTLAAPAPAAAPIVHRTYLVIPQSSAAPATPAVQACTWETAPAKLRAQIVDPIGYPYGEVSAWSCAGDGLAVANELTQRAAVMRAAAAIYRQAHPIGGAK